MSCSGKNIFIDYDIIINSDVDNMIKEFDLLIAANNYIYVWSSKRPVEEVQLKIKELGLYDYIWGYKTKDSFNYSCVDFIVDSDEKLVNRFKKNGIDGNVVSKI